MTKKYEKNWSRRITTVALLAALLTGGGIASHHSPDRGSAADGIPRCCI